MMAITSMITMKEMRGATLSTPVSNPLLLAVYTEAEIESMISGTNPSPEGIRLHVIKDLNLSFKHLIAVGLGIDSSIGANTRNLELFTGDRKYLVRGSDLEGRDITRTAFLTEFAGMQDKSEGNTNTCVFFSKLDLRGILAETDVNRIGFFQTTTTINSGIFNTLAAVGVKDDGSLATVQIRSELPCPPSCGNDYPPESVSK